MALFDFMVSCLYLAIGTGCVCLSAIVIVSTACTICKIIRRHASDKQ